MNQGKQSVRNRKPRNKRRLLKILLIVLPIFMVLFLLLEFGSHAVRMEGLRTTATVTDVQWQALENRPEDGRFQTTFEFTVAGEVITATRTSDIFNQGTGQAPWAVGQQVAIYYSSRRPSNFVFVEGSTAFGLSFWMVTVATTAGWVYSFKEHRKLKLS